MKWYYINTGFRSGKFNMALDINLAKGCKTDEAILRLYRWKPYCISLGANQDITSINVAKAINDNIDIVKRPTGGRAILHAEELTYSVVMPIYYNTSVRKIYSDINMALASGLKKYDRKLDFVELENLQPDFRNFYKEEKSTVCFAVPAKSELKFKGKKLAGSAQRKMGNVVLQHGSILCGDFHKNIINYLNISGKEKSAVISLLNSTADIYNITGRNVDYNLLGSSIVEGFGSYFKNDFELMFDYNSFIFEKEELYY